MSLQFHLFVLGWHSVLVTWLLNYNDLTVSLYIVYNDRKAALCLPLEVNSCFSLGCVNPTVATQVSVLSLISSLDAADVTGGTVFILG